MIDKSSSALRLLRLEVKLSNSIGIKKISFYLKVLFSKVLRVLLRCG